MLKKVLSLTLVIVFLLSCSNESKQKADLIVHNARIYTVNKNFTIHQAMVIKNGKVLELGNNNAILKKYTAPNIIDVDGNAIFPGFIDAHCHFVGYGLTLQQVDLTGTGSFNEVMERVQAFARKDSNGLDGPMAKGTQHNSSWLMGRGWDQNDWLIRQYPDNKMLDSLFPNRPVILTRIDGHAALANSEALRRANITIDTKISGGELVRNGNQLTGLLIDNAVDLVKAAIPQPGKTNIAHGILLAQQNCLAAGLTTVDDAGLMKSDVDLIDSLQRSGQLKLRVYAMLSDSLPNYEHYLKSGPYKTERLNVRAFKFYADGALGSRGACLFEDYSDKPGWKGFLLNTPQHFKTYAALMALHGFQMNTHCIGDSALSLMLDIYTKYCHSKKGEHRWRIEHAQVVNKKDFKRFSNDILPSVQPTHATSDMYWAIERLGQSRLAGAYAYRQLMKASGSVALGTDFPVEDISPLKTFYAAVTRQDDKGFPNKGFQAENALTREQALKGMTIWAAYANFEEHEKGSIEVGKLADFVVLDNDIMHCNLIDVLKVRVLATYINGEKVN